MKMRVFLICLLCFLFIFSAAHSADYVIVDTKGLVAFKVGQTLKAESLIQLKQGQGLTLVSKMGEKIALKGPLSGQLQLHNKPQEQVSGLDVVAVLTKLFSKASQDNSSLGVFRSLNQVEQPDTWVVDTAKGGLHCFQVRQAPRFWRSDNSTQSRFDFSSSTGRIALNWGKGKSELSWPIAIPYRDGESYQYVIDNKNTEQSLNLIELPVNLPTRIHMAAWMSDKGCERQALLLVLNAEIDKMIDDLTRQGKF